jgi:hypothetical protein
MIEVISQLDFRPLAEDDYSFVKDAWMRCFRFGSTLTKEIPSDIYIPRHGALIDNLLHRCITELVCLKEDPATILGFLVYERITKLNIIHFIYVKKDFRKMGLATALIANTKVDPDQSAYTHRTRANLWIDERYPKLIFDPYLIQGESIQ